MNRKRLLTAAIGALVAVAIDGGVAYATIPGPGNVYSACMLKGVGTIRLIDKMDWSKDQRDQVYYKNLERITGKKFVK